MNRIGACVSKQLPIERWRERTKNKNKKMLKNKTHQPQQSECNTRAIYIFKMFENRKILRDVRAHTHNVIGSCKCPTG